MLNLDFVVFVDFVKEFEGLVDVCIYIYLIDFRDDLWDLNLVIWMFMVI